ncbi:hypothetical protein BSU04_30710 [Caballeronia sordidicola]|uniref:Uncharacterized protein n=1 Tax=Caballeronia sordidicola TaxID=196367 RepID=A0A226WU16_CABSO|nr:hypothetical protein BSU04_30710 [Caballeronia sordidicola]
MPGRTLPDQGSHTTHPHDAPARRTRTTDPHNGPAQRI